MPSLTVSEVLRTRYRILILDPSPGMATGLASLLDGTDGIEARGQVVDARLQMPFSAGTETNGAGSPPPLPDAVLIDPGLCTLPPQALVPRLRDTFSRARLVGFAAENSPALARTCLSLGFHGFLSKSATLETIRLCLSALRAGAVFVDAPHATAFRTEPDGLAAPPARSLTEREAYVLKSVARGKSLKEIGYELSLSSKTVETYKARGTAKLNISGRREIVDYAIRAGWV